MLLHEGDWIGCSTGKSHMRMCRCGRFKTVQSLGEVTEIRQYYLPGKRLVYKKSSLEPDN